MVVNVNSIYKCVVGWLFVCALLNALSGCADDIGEAAITSVNVVSDDVVGGYRLEYQCSNCDRDRTQFQWFFDNSDMPFADTPQVSIELSRFVNDVTIQVTPYAENGEMGEVNTSVFTLNKVEKIVGNSRAFAALRTDGTVATWGSVYWGGESYMLSEQLRRVKMIAASSGAFAALRDDGTVVTWGSLELGGDSSSVQGRLQNIVAIAGSYGAFAALTEDGEVITWGHEYYGGDSLPVQVQLKNVVSLHGEYYHGGFTAIRADGSAVYWAKSSTSTPSVNDVIVPFDPIPSQSSKVVSVVPSQRAMAVLLENGTVQCWGDRRVGGECSSISNSLQNVVSVSTNFKEFAAVTSDGSVVVWGGQDSEETIVAPPSLNNVVAVAGTKSSTIFGAFAALKSNGTVTVWGNDLAADTTPVADQLTGVIGIYGNSDSFAALRSDGTVVTWGGIGQSESVLPELTNVETIVTSLKSFAAITSDGRVVVWGDPQYGGEPNVRGHVGGDIASIIPTRSAFLANKHDGSVVLWGDVGDMPDDMPSRLTRVKSFAQDNGNRFAAVNGDGSMVTWGSPIWNGSEYVSPPELDNVEKVVGVSRGGAALLDNGDVIGWGAGQLNKAAGAETPYGLLSNIVDIVGSRDFITALSADGLAIPFGMLASSFSSSEAIPIRDVKSIHSSESMLVVVKNDGTLYAVDGGSQRVLIAENFDYEWQAVTQAKSVVLSDRYVAVVYEDDQLTLWGSVDEEVALAVQQLGPVSTVVGGYRHMAAIMQDGTVEWWGNCMFDTCDEKHWIAPNKDDLVNVVSVTSAGDAFAAVKYDGSVVTWGVADDGGDSSTVQPFLSNVQAVYANQNSFVALKDDGTMVHWGNSLNYIPANLSIGGPVPVP